MRVKELMDLKGRTVLVTGGSGYIGSQICSTLLELGAKVISVSRGISPSFIDDIGNKNKLINLKHDLSTQNGVEDCIGEIKDNSDNVHILVNNFYTFPNKFNFLDQDWSDFEDTFSTSIVSPLYLTKCILEQMIEKKIKGNIINISSMYGKVAPDFKIYNDRHMLGNIGVGIEYCVAKAGLIEATKYIASYAGNSGIRCNSISPGPFSKPGTFKEKRWFESNLKNKTMINRIATNDDLKGAIVLLATDLGKYITGADIAVDGGWTA